MLVHSTNIEIEMIEVRWKVSKLCLPMGDEKMQPPPSQKPNPTRAEGSIFLNLLSPLSDVS